MDDKARLAAFDKMVADLNASQIEISEQLAVLRAQDKMKSVKFRELMTKKLVNSTTLATIKSYGID